MDWLRFPYIPFGKLTIIQGNPGEGKTYFATRLAAACTTRTPLPGMETLQPFNIIYQTAEDGLGDTVKPRLMEADAALNPSNVHFSIVTLQEEFNSIKCEPYSF